MLFSWISVGQHKNVSFCIIKTVIFMHVHTADTRFSFSSTQLLTERTGNKATHTHTGHMTEHWRTYASSNPHNQGTKYVEPLSSSQTAWILAHSRHPYLGLVSPKESERKTPGHVHKTASKDQVQKETQTQQSSNTVQAILFGRKQVHQIHDVQPEN